MKTFMKGDNIQKLNGRALSKFTLDTAVIYGFSYEDKDGNKVKASFPCRTDKNETLNILAEDIVKQAGGDIDSISRIKPTGENAGSVYYLYTDEIPSIARVVSDDKESKGIKACDNYRTLTKTVYTSTDGKQRISAPKGTALSFEGFNTDFEYTEETRYYGLMVDDITTHGMSEDSVIYQANAERQDDDE